jgi:hypothetical protein
MTARIGFRATWRAGWPQLPDGRRRWPGDVVRIEKGDQVPADHPIVAIYREYFDAVAG